MSYKDSGLMGQLETSTKYVPSFELTERVRKEEQKVRNQVVKNEKKLRLKEKELRLKAEKEYTEYKKALAHTLFEKGLSLEKIGEIMKSMSDEIKQKPEN